MNPRPSLLPVLALCLTGVALARSSENATERFYLSGRDKDSAVPWQFQCTSGAQSGYWTNLVVPSHWDLHGFGTLTYKKDATNAWNERGLYRHDFEAPDRWTGKRVFLVFEGVMTDTAAMLNGHALGPTHQGGFYRFKYEVTRYLRLGGSNRLEVTVARHSANESVNRAERLADYWVFAGIYRPVYLEVVPPEFIERVAIDARHDGAFTMDVYCDDPLTTAPDPGMEAPATVEARIKTLGGEAVGEIFSAPARRPKTTLTASIASPRPWTAETPNLYVVEVRLRRGNEVLHRYDQRFGFRTMEVRDGDGLYVNGQRVILKGVNRHSFWPDSGRCLSEAVHRLDIATIKDMNMNAVRMSHYPPDAEFLDLCDELGLYVLDELAGWHNHYDDGVGRKLVREMVARDVNHPSIVFWDNGNEGGFNTNLDAVFPECDPQGRRVLHPWAPFNGVNTAHYLAYSNAQVAAAGEPMYYQPKPNDEVVNTNLPGGWIYMPTEFLHGLYDGGAGAGLEDYWTMMTQSRLLGGGFIWVFCDEGVRRPDTGTIDTAGNAAPDGIVGPYREREASFYTIKQLWSPIQVSRDADGTLHIANHYSFLNTDQCAFIWQWRRFHGWNDAESGHSVLDEGRVAVPSIGPGERASFMPALPAKPTGADALALIVQDPDGRELWTWVWELPGAERPVEDPIHENGPAPTPATVADAGEVLQVKAGDLVLEFSRRTGMLTRLTCGSQTFSLSGPRAAHGPSRLESFHRSSDGTNVTVTAEYEGALKMVVWTVGGDGSIRCDYRYEAEGTVEYRGVVFDHPQDLVKSKRWLGEGPYRVWKNRLPGGTLDVWENAYNNTITGYSEWLYPEFKGCFAGVRWMQWVTEKGVLTIVPGAPTFLQSLAPEQPPEPLRGRTGFDLPACGFGLLGAIPPVGSKFKAAASMGPQGQLAQATGSYTGSLRLFLRPSPSPEAR